MFADDFCEAWADLAVAVLQRAVRDARSSNGVAAEARSFLHSHGAAWLAALVGLDVAVWRAAVATLPAGDYQLELDL